MVSSARATAAGIASHALSQLAGRGVLERLVHGIYRLAGVPPGPHDDLRAAWKLADGLPLTTALRTIEDLAVSHLDRGHLAGVVRDAMVRQLLSWDEVVATLAPHERDA